MNEELKIDNSTSGLKLLTLVTELGNYIDLSIPHALC